MDFFSILKQAIISSFTASQKDSTHAKWFEAFIKIKKNSFVTFMRYYVITECADFSLLHRTAHLQNILQKNIFSNMYCQTSAKTHSWIEIHWIQNNILTLHSLPQD